MSCRVCWETGSSQSDLDHMHNCYQVLSTFMHMQVMWRIGNTCSLPSLLDLGLHWRDIMAALPGGWQRLGNPRKQRLYPYQTVCPGKTIWCNFYLVLIGLVPGPCLEIITVSLCWLVDAPLNLFTKSWKRQPELFKFQLQFHHAWGKSPVALFSTPRS